MKQLLGWGGRVCQSRGRGVRQRRVFLKWAGPAQSNCQVLKPIKSPSVCAQSLSHVQLFVTPWTVACQAPLSLGFSRQEYWRGLPFLSPGDLPDPEIQPCLLHWQADSFPLSQLGRPKALAPNSESELRAPSTGRCRYCMRSTGEKKKQPSEGGPGQGQGRG